MPIERAQPLQGGLELRVISPKERMRATAEPQGTGRCIIDGLIPDFHLKWLVLRASPWRLQDIFKARKMAERKASLVQISFFRLFWCCFSDFGSTGIQIAKSHVCKQRTKQRPNGPVCGSNVEARSKRVDKADNEGLMWKWGVSACGDFEIAERRTVADFAIAGITGKIQIFYGPKIQSGLLHCRHRPNGQSSDCRGVAVG